MDIKGTNELISGEKPSIAILSNLRCLFTRLQGLRVETTVEHSLPQKSADKNSEISPMPRCVVIQSNI